LKPIPQKVFNAITILAKEDVYPGWRLNNKSDKRQANSLKIIFEI